MKLGKIVASDSHLQYRCRIYAPGETESPPAPSDYALGTFVSLVTGSDTAMVGVICDTVLQTPEFGVYGPRLSTGDETVVFSPDYVDEACTLVTIVALGHMEGGKYSHDASPIAPPVNCEVSSLPVEEVRAFHLGPAGLRLAYVPLLLGLTRTSPAYSQALLRLLAGLKELFPDGEAHTRLCLLSQSLSWRLRVESLA